MEVFHFLRYGIIIIYVFLIIILLLIAVFSPRETAIERFLLNTLTSKSLLITIFLIELVLFIVEMILFLS